LMFFCLLFSAIPTFLHISTFHMSLLESLTETKLTVYRGLSIFCRRLGSRRSVTFDRQLLILLSNLLFVTRSFQFPVLCAINLTAQKVLDLVNSERSTVSEELQIYFFSWIHMHLFVYLIYSHFILFNTSCLLFIDIIFVASIYMPTYRMISSSFFLYTQILRVCHVSVCQQFTSDTSLLSMFVRWSDDVHSLFESPDGNQVDGLPSALHQYSWRQLLFNVKSLGGFQWSERLCSNASQDGL